jgi:hypothetical protein
MENRSIGVTLSAKQPCIHSHLVSGCYCIFCGEFVNPFKQQKTGEATAYDPVPVDNAGANVVSAHDLAIAGGVKLSAPQPTTEETQREPRPD